MEKWLMLPIATKALDMLLILAATGVIGGFILFFIKTLREITKKGDVPSVEFGPVKIGPNKKDEKEGTVVVNVNSNKGAEEEAARELASEGYKPPKGVPPFTQHRFFRTMDEAMAGRVVQLKSRHPQSQYAYLKNKAFAHFLFSCKSKVFRDMIADYVDDVLDSHGDFTVLSSIKKRTERSIKQYEDIASTSHVKVADGEFLLRIPELMLIKFNEWHQPHINLVTTRLSDILDSQFYSSWQLKLIAILDTFEIIFKITFDYAEYSLMDLNGDLDAALIAELMTKKDCP